MDMIYPGGKGGIYQKHINLMPPHEVYIEPYLGGGAVMRKKRPAKVNIGIEIDMNAIEMWSDIATPKDMQLICGDAIGFLKEYKFTGKELVYCDPPYLRNTRKKIKPIYKYEYTTKQHIELLKVITALPCMVMICGYESQLYTDTLKDWFTHSFQAKTHKGTAIEWVWMNYSHPKKLHDYRFL
ncbi:MAG: DNA adenine methylase, partial [Deltaproteobacteria bacterium]|nr:DNA adenine methylase [Deltaproteobacteria bacterium]